MRIIASVLVDKHGHIKYMPQCFKPNECDICISNLSIGKLGKKTLFYAPLEFDNEYGEDICWTTKEVIRRCGEYNANSIKIFTQIQDFYSEITELQFAYTDELNTFDETLNMDDLKVFCKNAKREYLGEMKNIKFFRYSIDNEK